MRSSSIDILSPSPNQVFQRGQNNSADIPVTGTLPAGAGSVEYRLGDGEWQAAPVSGGAFTGLVRDVPVGGPYTLEIRISGTETRRIPGLLVGDLWILAGQSNMDGCGKLINLETPSRMVHAFYYNETWGIARDPICALNESIDPVHWQFEDPEDRAGYNRMLEDFPDMGRGGGLGVRFGKDMYKATGTPVGLLMCSHGGTSLAQWDPGLKSEGGRSLYGSMLRRVKVAGGKVAGCLWYQGESDAVGPEAGVGYKENFRRLIESVREDLNSPDLPFIYVQLAAYFVGDLTYDAGWNHVQADQLALESEMKNVAMVPAIDLNLSDTIHVDSLSLRRLGARMAMPARRICLREPVKLGPRPASFAFEDGSRTRIRVSFREVNGCLRPTSSIHGFSLWAGEERRVIKSCARDRNDPCSVIITLAEPAPEGAVLWYGRGISPTCNLADAKGFPCPVFGPIAV